MRKVMSIVGARPQFVKAAAIDRAFQRVGHVKHILLHTGQHYDEAMSQVFFDELGIPPADMNLGVGSGRHGQQTARMLEGVERALIEHRPESLILYGDTNSTVAGALAAAKLHVPIAHVEAGLRSFNKAMPEEVNRILCDHCSTWLFCPTAAAVRNLEREGFRFTPEGSPSMDRPHVHMTGDVMLDSSLHFAAIAVQRSDVLQRLGIATDEYMLATIHRDFNTDDPNRLLAICSALQECSGSNDLPVIMPVHPRTRERILRLESEGHSLTGNNAQLRLIPPVGYLDMIELERNARLILTDSGGVQKEAYFFKKPCVVLRPETEWVELVEHGQASLVDADPQRIQEAVGAFLKHGIPSCEPLYGDGHAAETIVRCLIE